MKSLFFFVLDMWCAAVDAALHVFEDEPEMSPAADESDLSPTKEGTA